MCRGGCRRLLGGRTNVRTRAQTRGHLQASFGRRLEGKSQVNLQDIIDAIQHNRIRVTDHADEEAQADRIPFAEILSSVFQGEIIEEYPRDKPYPSCLVYGETSARNPVHSVWAYNRENRWAVLITVYRPDPKRWVDGRKRRPEDASI